MKMSFSTLACPDWTMPQIIAIASTNGYEGIELRFVENEDALWKLPAFRGRELPLIKRALQDHSLAIPCVDTSCRFHFPDANQRTRWFDEGVRMADLAASLGAPGIRVFGDAIQPGATRASTRSWIAESIRKLAENIASTGVEVWLETHGDFASAPETEAILVEAGQPPVGVVWDPANCLLEHGETPQEGGARLQSSIRLTHLKDLCLEHKKGKHALTGDGNFPLMEVRTALQQLNYSGFVSFEWEKKWHPEIPDANLALPHFARWFRENWT
jgi:sugar phosphate isomerase/epimerase